MPQDSTCEIISQSNHLFNSKSKCSIYVYHWMRLIRFHVNILAASDTGFRLRNTLRLGVVTTPVQMGTLHA